MSKSFFGIKLIVVLNLFLAAGIAQSSPFCARELGVREANHRAVKPVFHFAEVRDFVVKNEILREDKLKSIEARLHYFQMNSEDMGNALLLHVLDALGNEPSPRRDKVILEFLAPTFHFYFEQFRKFAQAQSPGISVKVPALYGIAKFGFKADAYHNFNWTRDDSFKFISQTQNIVSQDKVIDLNAVNRVLVQLGYLHSMLTHQKKMGLAELNQSSAEFEMAMKMGHVFVPVVGEWDISNINAQWALGTTVNMLPPTFDSVIDVRGGLSTIEGLSHDHGHFYKLRLEALFKVFKVIPSRLALSRPDRQVQVLGLDRKLGRLIEKALALHDRLKDPTIDNAVLTNTVFFFIHQPESIESFLSAIRDGQQNWSIHSADVQMLAHQMRQTLELHAELYPNLGTKYDEFEMTARYFLSLLGRQEEAKSLF